MRPVDEGLLRTDTAAAMTLSQKTLTIVLLTVVGLMAVLYVTARVLLLQSYRDLESEEVLRALDRGKSALDNQITDLAATATDYGAWDRIYAFMRRRPRSSIGREFANDILQGLSVNSVLLMDTSGKVVYTKSYDLVHRRETEYSVETRETLASDPWVQGAQSTEGRRWGILVLPRGLVLIAASPILTTSHQGPARGVLLMIRDLDEGMIKGLGALTLSSIHIEPVFSSKLSSDVASAANSRETNAQSSVVEPIDSASVTGYMLLRDVHGQPALVLRVNSPRTVYQRGLTGLRYLLGGLCAASLIFGMTTLILLRRAILAPLTRLNTQVGRIAVSEDHAGRIAITGDDEISGLGSTINSMLEALQENTTVFRHLVENIHQVFWIKDAATHAVVYLSPAYETIWGLNAQPGNQARESWLGTVHPEDRAIVQQLLEQESEGRTGGAEFRTVRADGRTRWVWNRHFPVRNERGQVTQVIGLAEDITEYKLAEEVLLRSQEQMEALVHERTAELAQTNTILRQEVAERMRTQAELHASREHFKQLFATIPVPIWLYDQRTLRFLEVNDAMVASYGYSRKEFLQMTIGAIVADEQSGRDMAPVQAAQTVSQEWKHRTKDGRVLDVEVRSQPVRFTRASAVLVAARDVTEHNRMEVELRHGQKLQAVGGLAAGIAHEINTPIQFIGDNVRFLRDSFQDLESLLEKYAHLLAVLHNGSLAPPVLQEVADAERKADLNFLRREIPASLEQTLDGLKRVATIVQALKQFSRIDAGREKAAADLNRALESTIIVARNELKYVAEVETQLGELPPVLCYLGDLNQVFLNLLVNAAHAITDVVRGTQRKGRIRVETKAEGEWAVVNISDTGVGIPEHIRGRIFEPFFTTKEVGRGTGQGLALARAIVVEKHGGTLTFETEPGKGTTFCVRIPVNGLPASTHEVPVDAASGRV